MEINSGEFIKIKVQIAGRWYPLKVRRSEEQTLRNAIKLLENQIIQMERNYDVASKQDLLAMCALQLANTLISTEKKREEEYQRHEYQLSEIYNTLESGTQGLPTA